jgi:hypothetical protein
MNINIKRFSRSKVDKPEEPEVKRPRGRPKKSTSVEPEAPHHLNQNLNLNLKVCMKKIASVK